MSTALYFLNSNLCRYLGAVKDIQSYIYCILSLIDKKAVTQFTLNGTEKYISQKNLI